MRSISDLPCTGDVVSLSRRKLETVWQSRKALILNDSFFWKKLWNCNADKVHDLPLYTSIGCHCSWFILFKRQPFFNQVYTLYFHYTPPYLISVWVKYQLSVLNTIYPCSCTLCISVFDVHFFHHTEEYYHCLKDYLTCLKKVNWNILNAHQLPGTSGDIVTDSRLLIRS